MVMDQNSIVLRAANPTFDEGVICGRYLDEVAEGFFHLMLGRRFADIIARAYPQTNHSYSFQNVIYVEFDRRIIGMALGYTAEQHRRFSEQPLKKAAGFRVLRMTMVNILFAPMLRILETIADGEFYLLSMAVDKDFRGEGIGLVLMDFIEDRARASGSTRLSLDVAEKNRGAFQFYEQRGMTIESKWPKRIPLPGLGFYRMTKAL
jgi:ribosomal protein S18 acetylase RimI-like enzyme